MGEINAPDPATSSTDGFPEVPNKWIAAPKTRLWLYGVILAVLGLLVVYGIVNIEQASAWAIVAAAALGIGGVALAARNVPR